MRTAELKLTNTIDPIEIAKAIISSSYTIEQRADGEYLCITLEKTRQPQSKSENRGTISDVKKIADKYGLVLSEKEDLTARGTPRIKRQSNSDSDAKQARRQMKTNLPPTIIERISAFSKAAYKTRDLCVEEAIELYLELNEPK